MIAIKLWQLVVFLVVLAAAVSVGLWAYISGV